MKEIILDKEVISGEVILTSEIIKIEYQNEKFEFSIKHSEQFEHFKRLKVDGVSGDVILIQTQDSSEFLIEGHRFVVKNKKNSRSGSAHNVDGQVLSPMPGKIVKVFVKVGDKIKSGDPLLVLEAMKMEHTLKSPRNAEVLGLNIAVGDMVQSEKELVLLSKKEG